MSVHLSICTSLCVSICLLVYLEINSLINCVFSQHAHLSVLCLWPLLSFLLLPAPHLTSRRLSCLFFFPMKHSKITHYPSQTTEHGAQARRMAAGPGAIVIPLPDGSWPPSVLSKNQASLVWSGPPRLDLLESPSFLEGRARITYFIHF
jgi:hypothetical protein